MESAGETEERDTPTHLEVHKNVRVRGERTYVVRGKKPLYEIESDGEH